MGWAMDEEFDGSSDGLCEEDGDPDATLDPPPELCFGCGEWTDVKKFTKVTMYWRKRKMPVCQRCALNRNAVKGKNNEAKN